MLPCGKALHESDARAFQERLASIARARSVKWSFQRRCGDLVRSVFEDTKSWDILLLGHREIHKRRGQVVVITSEPDETGRASQIARELADGLNTSVLALSELTGAAETARKSAHGDMSDADALMLSQLGRINATAVVIDGAGRPPPGEDLVRQILGAAWYPVLIF